MEMRCPICEMGELIESVESETIMDLFAGEIEVRRKFYTCSVCGESADFFNENEPLQIEIEKSKKLKSIENIIDKFEKRGLKLASIERSLELPQRTLSKWKNDHVEASAAAIALLKYIYTYPWLLELADRNYDPQEAQLLLWRESFSSLSENCGAKLVGAGIHIQGNYCIYGLAIENKTDNSKPPYSILGPGYTSTPSTIGVIGQGACL